MFGCYLPLEHLHQFWWNLVQWAHRNRFVAFVEPPVGWDQDLFDAYSQSKERLTMVSYIIESQPLAETFQSMAGMFFLTSRTGSVIVKMFVLVS